LGTTYLGLVNKLLNRLNETELTADNLLTARGIHAAARQAVVDSVNKIQNYLFQLNVNAAEHEMTLVRGVSEYPWPPSFKSADWTSFYIVRDDTFNVGNTPLRKINREEWYLSSKSDDDNLSVEGRGVPSYVFESHGHGFGVSPTPLNDYKICFRYYFNQTNLNNPTDECTIPSQFDYVILNGASYYMKLFKEDTEQAAAMSGEFKNGLADIRALLMTRRDHMTDTRLGRRSRGFF
jgi:hypothetical protein